MSDVPRAPESSAEPPRSANGVSRRSFIQTMGVSAAAGAITTAPAESAAPRAAAAPEVLGPDAVRVEMRLNGAPAALDVEPTTTLLEALRLDLDRTGSKEICDRGACGGCSVIVDGALVASCMMLAVDADGAEVTTIEGVADGTALHPVQEAFIRHDALQCGYCTPGLVVAAKALLDENPRPTLDDIKRGLAGNQCRCGTFTNVFNAILDASGQAPLRDAGGAS